MIKFLSLFILQRNAFNFTKKWKNKKLFKSEMILSTLNKTPKSPKKSLLTSHSRDSTNWKLYKLRELNQKSLDLIQKIWNLIKNSFNLLKNLKTIFPMPKSDKLSEAPKPYLLILIYLQSNINFSFKLLNT